MLLVSFFTIAVLMSSFTQETRSIEHIEIIPSTAEPNLGILQISIDGAPGYICNQDPEWTLQGDSVAQVACNQLNYEGSNHRIVTFMWDFTMHVQRWLFGINCAGNESSLADCELGDWNGDGFCFSVAGVLCDETEDQQLDVRLVGKPTENEGVIQVFYNGIWATVCDIFDAHIPEEFLSVVCRQLGFISDTTPARNTFAPVPGGGAFELLITDGIACSGSETSLDQCGSEKEWIIGFDSCSPRIYEISCSSDTCSIGDLRLAGTEGDLPEVLYQGGCSQDGSWLHMCARNDREVSAQDNAVAGVVCAQLGYRGVGYSARLVTPAAGEVVTDNLRVTCAGHETSIQECDVTELSSTGILFCQALVGVVCDETEYPSCPDRIGWFTPHLQDTSCFNLFAASDDIHWKTAEKLCKDNDGTLATIRDARDLDLIAYILQQERDPDVRANGVYIGFILDDNIDNTRRTRRWADGRPMSFTKWNTETGEPNGGYLEACTKLVYSEGSDGLGSWFMSDIPCIAPQTKYYMCTAHAAVQLGEPIQPIIGSGCGSGMFPCTSGECIHRVNVCDGNANCNDGEDEENCDEASAAETFQCATPSINQTISVSFVCDFIPHCLDSSDEITCDYPSCKRGQFQCGNRRCIEEVKVCDTVADCQSGADELRCERDFISSPLTFHCYNGQVISSETVCDGQQDCIGLSEEDEPQDCPYRSGCVAEELQCDNMACYDATYRCIYGYTHHGYPLGCRDASHLLDCDEFECPVGTAKCPGSYCIQLQHMCDGLWDCPNGEDEQKCDMFECPGHYRCQRKATDDRAICVTSDELCDGIANCPLADDELFCGLECPDACVCEGLTYVCDGTTWSETHALSIAKDIKHLNLTNRQIPPTSSADVTIRDVLLLDAADLPLLIYLDLAANGINKLSPEDFVNNGNLRTLNLSGNNIQNMQLEKETFKGLDRLEYLDLRGNPLHKIDLKFILNLPKLRFLDIRDTEIDVRASELDMIEPPPPSNGPNDGVNDGPPVYFEELEMLYSDNHYFCCLLYKYQPNAGCFPEPDVFSSCEDLLRYEFLSSIVWIIGLSALLGNLFVIAWRAFPHVGRHAKTRHLKSRRHRAEVQSILITNLAVSDGMMGIYMLIIASADAYYRGIYAFNAERWQTSRLCKFAGFLSVLSSEASVFFITIISLDRFFCIVFTMKHLALRPTGARIAAISAWGAAFFFSVLPLLPIEYFKDELEFYGRSPVCLALPLTKARPAGWEYSVALFLCLNLAAFCIVFICYIMIFWTVRKSGKEMRNTKNREEIWLALRMGLLIITDFCCWIPVVTMGFLALIPSVTISNAAYVWTAVFVLPLNSALNPYLYTIATREMKKFREEKKSKVKLTTPAFSSLDVLPFANQLIIALKTADQSRYRNYKLANVLRERVYFTAEDIDTIEKDIRRSLDYLHARAICHGAVNEQNILLENNEGWRGYLMVSTDVLGQKVQTPVQTTRFSSPNKMEKQYTQDLTNHNDDVDPGDGDMTFEMDGIYQKDLEQMEEVMNKIRTHANRDRSIAGQSLFSATNADSLTGSTSVN